MTTPCPGRMSPRLAAVCLIWSLTATTFAQPPAGNAATVPPEYQVPKTQSVEQLASFLEKWLAFNPKTPAEMQTYQQFAPEAMTEAAQRILELETDRSSDSFLFAQRYLLAVDVMSIDQATAEEVEQLKQIISGNLKSATIDADDLDIAVAFAEGLESIGNARGAASAYADFAVILKSKQDPLISELAELMEGSARRLGMIGHVMEVSGTTLDGQPFNWNAYRGKTVLIDFWASWCGPCRAEMPAIKKYYESYHNKGFDVVGICLDDERAPVDEFLSQMPLPWVTLFEGEGKTNPTATHYGVSSLPTTVLVDPQGKVISLTARGEELGKLLEQRFGPAR